MAIYYSDPRRYRVSLADISSQLGAHVVLCSAPEEQPRSWDQIENVNVLQVVEQLPKHLKDEYKFRVSSIVDSHASNCGKWCRAKVRSVTGSQSTTHDDDFSRDITGVPGKPTTEFNHYMSQHRDDIQEKAKMTRQDFHEVAKTGFAIKNSQWSSYWRGKVSGALSMALMTTPSRECSERDLRALGLGDLKKDTLNLRTVIAVVIDGGPVNHQEQREIAHICDEIVYDLRRKGYAWAGTSYVLPVRFPDVETLLRSLAGEKNLLRSTRFCTRQRDDFRFVTGEATESLTLSMAWEFTKTRDDKEAPKQFSFFEHGWTKALESASIHATNLYISATTGDLDGTRRLLEAKAELVAAKLDDGRTALVACAADNLVDSMKLLLSQCKDERKLLKYVNRGGKDGVTATHAAAENGSNEALQLLLEQKADVNTSSDIGVTPLHRSAHKGQKEAVQILLRANADVSKPNKNGVEPIHNAATNGHSPALQLLLQAKAEVNKPMKYGYTPLHKAADNGHTDTVKCLLLAKADLDTARKNGSTPTHDAAENGYTEVLQTLLNFNASVNKCREDGATPLHVAAVNGHTEVMRCLLQAKADLNISEESGATPVYEAARTGQSTAVQFLLQAKANANKSNKYGMKPLDIAKLEGHDSVIVFLK